MIIELPKTAHWQPALTGKGFVADLEDIFQCVDTILTTPIGSVPLRPDFGSNIFLYVDYPINRARPHLVRETVDALKKWEPRIVCRRATVGLNGDSNLVITPFLELSDGVVISRGVRL